MQVNRNLLNAKRGLLPLLCIVCSNIGFCQTIISNLVPNHSFEDYTVCPVSAGNDIRPNHWYKPDKRSAGYLNSCSDSTVLGVPIHVSIAGVCFQYAKTGVAYMNAFFMNNPGLNHRNYIAVKLLDSLRKGKCYYAEYFVNLSNPLIYACNNQAMLFTPQPVYVDTLANLGILPANPQVVNFGNPIISDTLNWVKVSGVFVAQGGEQYLTLGNFKWDSETNYLNVNPSGGYYGAVYYMDDVSVYALDSLPLPADAGADRSIVIGDSTYIGSYTSGINNISWYSRSGIVIATGVPGLKVGPAASTFYVVEHTVCGNYSRDTVHVTVTQPVPLNFLSYHASLQNGAVLHRWNTVNEMYVSKYNIQRSEGGSGVFSLLSSQPALNGTSNSYSFIEEKPLKGLNFYRIEAIDLDGSRKYSQVVKVNAGKERLLRLYPNPCKDLFYLSGDKIKEVQVRELAGKALIKEMFGGVAHAPLNVAGLPRGIYMVTVIMNDGKIETLKLLLQ